MPKLTGIHHVKFPVTDLARSRRWYEQVFGLQPPQLEFRDEEDGPVMGVAYMQGPTPIALRHDPAVAQGIHGFDPVSFAIAGQTEAEQWVEHLEALGIRNSGVVEATLGWIVVFHDPDGTEIHLYSDQPHGHEIVGRPGFGTPTP